MATTYQKALVRLAKHCNALAGATAATQSTNYAVTPATTTTVNNAVYSLDFLNNLLIDTHGRIALAIASSVNAQGIGNHPWRAFFRDLTANLSHGANLPTVGSGTKTIIGAYGEAYDSSDTDQVLTRASVQRVSKYKNNTGIYTNNPWLWTISGGKVWHTTTNITIDVCVYERSDQVSAVASGNISIPDVLEDLLVAGAVAQAVINEKNLNQAQLFAEYYKSGIEMIMAGGTAIPQLALAA